MSLLRVQAEKEGKGRSRAGKGSRRKKGRPVIKAAYIQDGMLTDDLLPSILLLAQIDPFFRTGVLYEPFAREKREIVKTCVTYLRSSI